MVKNYYSGMCETCHIAFVNLSRWQVIKARFRHKHILQAIIYSNATFYRQMGKQTGYEEIKLEEDVKS